MHSHARGDPSDSEIDDAHGLLPPSSSSSHDALSSTLSLDQTDALSLALEEERKEIQTEREADKTAGHTQPQPKREGKKKRGGGEKVREREKIKPKKKPKSKGRIETGTETLKTNGGGVPHTQNGHRGVSVVVTPPSVLVAQDSNATRPDAHTTLPPPPTTSDTLSHLDFVQDRGESKNNSSSVLSPPVVSPAIDRSPVHTQIHGVKHPRKESRENTTSTHTQKSGPATSFQAKLFDEDRDTHADDDHTDDELDTSLTAEAFIR